MSRLFNILTATKLAMRPRRKRRSLSFRDPAVEQAHAAWQAVHYARVSVRVAIWSAAINAAVIATAILGPAYSKSLDTVTSNIQEKDRLRSAIIAAFSAVKDAQDTLSDRGPLNKSYCETANTISSRESTAMDVTIARSENHRKRSFDLADGDYSVRALGTLVERVYEGEEDAFLVLKDNVKNGSKVADRSIDCVEAAHSLYLDADTLRKRTIEAYREFRKPVRRPFGLLNGKEVKTGPIYMDGSLDELDEELLRTELTWYADKEIEGK